VDALLLLAGIDHDRSSSPLDEGDTKVQGRTVEWSNPPRRGGVAGWAGLWWVLLADGCRRHGGFHVSCVLKNVRPVRAKGSSGSPTRNVPHRAARSEARAPVKRSVRLTYGVIGRRQPRRACAERPGLTSRASPPSGSVGATCRSGGEDADEVCGVDCDCWS
jgi:hypothetical protein